VKDRQRIHVLQDLIMHLHPEVFINWVRCRGLDSISLARINLCEGIVVTAKDVQKVVSRDLHWEYICIFSFEPARQTWTTAS
jgi:hypothetical protein